MSSWSWISTASQHRGAAPSSCHHIWSQRTSLRDESLTEELLVRRVQRNTAASSACKHTEHTEGMSEKSFFLIFDILYFDIQNTKRTRSDIFRFYILYINILESYLSAPMCIQMCKLSHSLMLGCQKSGVSVASQLTYRLTPERLFFPALSLKWAVFRSAGS